MNNFKLMLLGLDPGFVKLYAKYIFKPNPGSIDEIIDERAKKIPNFRFLQIGGNDGFVNDPIFKFVKRFSWKGIIVEPQKEVFENRLSKTYRFEKNVILENVAIADKSGMRKLYKLGFSNARWATGLASFNRKTLEFQIERNYVAECAQREGVELPQRKEDYIVTEDVPCSTITDLLAKHHMNHIDLLQIDTEGYDFEIIKHIDFSTLKPALISYEHEHLSQEDIQSCENLLRSEGYIVKQKDRDSIAILG